MAALQYAGWEAYGKSHARKAGCLGLTGEGATIDITRRGGRRVMAWPNDATGAKPAASVRAARGLRSGLRT